jgi:DNA-binding MarR family transcriptional regulator
MTNPLPGQLETFSNYLQTQGRDLITEAFRNHGLSGLTILQLNYLEWIEKNPGLTPSALAEHYHVSKPTVANILKRLEAAGLVEREKSADDSRVFHIHPTRAAMDIFEARRQMFTHLAAIIEARLVQSDIATLVRLFGQIVPSIESEAA